MSRRRGIGPEPPGSDYDVGYGKPPEASRFRKGRSGNPGGRPKGAKTRNTDLGDDRLKGLILEEAYRGIEIREGDRTLTVPMAKAVIRSVGVSALKGKISAQRLFAELLTEVEAREREQNIAWFSGAVDYKIQWERELDRRQRLGIAHLPDPLPHPDHILIDPRSGTARIVGPATKEEKRLYDADMDELSDLLWVEGFLKDELASERGRRRRAVLESSLAQLKAKIDMYLVALPPDLLARARSQAEQIRIDHERDPEKAAAEFRERWARIGDVGKGM